MKSFIYKFMALIIIFLLGCERSDKDQNVESILNTKWTLSKIINNETEEITEFPKEIGKFDIVFRNNGKIDLPDYCNYSYGKYKLFDIDSLNIYNVGPGTYRYCKTDIYMDWETLFINNLNATETYLIKNNNLTVNCSSEYDLVFNFVDNYDTDQGKILFCTNSHIINCPFEIDVSINEKSYSLSASSAYSDIDCQCDNSLDIGLLINLKKGTYDYTANELNCIAENKVNTWSGQVEVIADSCMVVFLDVNE